jgi:hypothetical protein
VTDEVSLEMIIPLDRDGFVRRACPTCERDFKWLHTESDEAGQHEVAKVAPAGYFCPYCGIQAETNQWLTQTQVEYARNLVASRALGPMIKDFGADLAQIGRQSGGFVTADLHYDAPDEFDPLTEADDMTRVDFACHPSEPVKVLDDWTKTVHCLLCGARKR